MEKTINLASACTLLDARWQQIIKEDVQDHLDPVYGAYAGYRVLDIYDQMTYAEILSFFEDMIYRGARLTFYASDLNKTIRPMLKY